MTTRRDAIRDALQTRLDPTLPWGNDELADIAEQAVQAWETPAQLDIAERIVTRNAAARAIVRDLAAATTGPNDESPDLAIPLSDYALKCFFCGAVANVDVVPHEDSCLVRRAREWVSTHPAKDD